MRGAFMVPPFCVGLKHVPNVLCVSTVAESTGLGVHVSGNRLLGLCGSGFGAGVPAVPAPSPLVGLEHILSAFYTSAATAFLLRVRPLALAKSKRLQNGPKSRRFICACYKSTDRTPRPASRLDYVSGTTTTARDSPLAATCYLRVRVTCLLRVRPAPAPAPEQRTLNKHAGDVF